MLCGKGLLNSELKIGSLKLLFVALLSTNTKQCSLDGLEVVAAQSGDHNCQKLLPCSLNFRGERGSELGRDHNS